MAIGMIFNPPKDVYNKEIYDEIMKHLGDSFPPPSMSLHVFGINDQGEVRIVDIFDSVDAFQEFVSTHAPVYEKLGVDVDEMTKHVSFFEVERAIK